MYEWLLSIWSVFTPLAGADTQQDYVGVLAAEAAYASLIPAKEVTPDRPIDPNCGTCKGTGKVPSGDGQGWTKCPTCQAGDVAPETTEKVPFEPKAPQRPQRITSEVPKPTALRSSN